MAFFGKLPLDARPASASSQAADQLALCGLLVLDCESAFCVQSPVHALDITGVEYPFGMVEEKRRRRGKRTCSVESASSTQPRHISVREPAVVIAHIKAIHVNGSPFQAWRQAAGQQGP